MDEIEVEVVNPKIGQGFPTSCLHLFWVVLCVSKLACDEDLRAGNSRGNNACPHFCLVAIGGSTVKVAVAFSIMESINQTKMPLANEAELSVLFLLCSCSALFCVGAWKPVYICTGIVSLYMSYFLATLTSLNFQKYTEISVSEYVIGTF